MINWELYKVFCFAARSGSLSEAAKQLYITQPSVSHSVKLLEEQLGLQLFSRVPRGVELTKDGAMLYSYLEHAYSFIAMAEEKTKELTSFSGGEIKIGGSDSLVKHFLLPFLESFHREFPGIQINLVHGTTPEIMKHLKEGRIDLGLVRLPVQDEALHFEEGIVLQDCFVAGPKYKELMDHTVSMEELVRYPIILFSSDSHSRQFVTSLFREHGLTLTPEIELGSVDLLIEFAKIGFGISFVAREFVTKELKDGSLFEIKLREPIPPTKTGIVTLKKMSLSKAASEFAARMNLSWHKQPPI
jgi:DNA-binding transcriptional LysR family regulator